MIPRCASRVGCCAWLQVVLVACSAPTKPSATQYRQADVPVVQVAPPPPSPPSLGLPTPEAAAAPAPVTLDVELLLRGVELAWPMGDVVLAETFDDGMQRELVLVQPGGVSPLRQLSRALALDQFVRVEHAYGVWPTQVWIEVQADLISSKRVELHRIDAKRQVSRLMAQLEGSMQARLYAAELADGWLFVIHDPLGGSAGMPRFAGLSPLPSTPALPTVGPGCDAPSYEVCGMRGAEHGGFELLALMCGRTAVTVSWRDRRAKPSVRVLPAVATSPRCDEHPDLRSSRAQPELRLEDGRLYARSKRGAQVQVSTAEAPLEGKIEDAFVVDGRTWLVAGGQLYRQLAASEVAAQPTSVGGAAGLIPPGEAPRANGE